MLNRPRPLVLLILDGFGCSLEKQYKAVDIAKEKGKALHIMGLLSPGGNLSDLARTMLDILGVPLPVEMTGRSLLAAH